MTSKVSKAAVAEAAFLTAVGEPTRLAIIRCLAGGPRTVTAIADAVGVEMVNASHHLGVMRAAAVVSCEKSGRCVMYTLNDFQKSPDNGTVHIHRGNVCVSLYDTKTSSR